MDRIVCRVCGAGNSAHLPTCYACAAVLDKDNQGEPRTVGLLGTREMVAVNGYFVLVPNNRRRHESKNN